MVLLQKVREKILKQIDLRISYLTNEKISYSRHIKNSVNRDESTHFLTHT